MIDLVNFACRKCGATQRLAAGNDWGGNERWLWCGRCQESEHFDQLQFPRERASRSFEKLAPWKQSIASLVLGPLCGVMLILVGLATVPGLFLTTLWPGFWRKDKK